MNLNYILLWIVGLSLVALFLRLVQRPLRQSRGWIIITSGLLVLAGVLVIVVPNYAGFIIFTLWLIGVLLPLIGAAQTYRLANQGYFQQAAQLSLVLRWFHPLDGWWQQPDLYRAMQLGQQGEHGAASAILETYQRSQPVTSQIASLLSFRMNAQWDRMRELLHHQRFQAVQWQDSGWVAHYLRALGETGDLNGLLSGIAQAEPYLERMADIPTLNQLRLFAFAFCGQPDQVQAILYRSFSGYADTMRQYWLATAEQGGGDGALAESALRQLQDGDQALALAAKWRLAHPMPNPHQVLTSESWRLLARLQTDSYQDAYYSGRSLPKHPPFLTYSLIIINLAMFALELGLGGSENLATLYTLGALDPALVWQGEWWRLLAANFLHFGVVHLGMNMLGLYLLGRYVELTLGSVRYGIGYAISGLGAMATITLLALVSHDETRIVVGASGAIMGLVGMLAAIFLYGWRRERSRFAKRQFRLIMLVIGLQVVFDLSTPQVSILGHTSGLIIGFLTGLGLLIWTKPTHGSQKRFFK